MPVHSGFQVPDPGRRSPLYVVIGTGVSFALFVIMALAQMIGHVQRSETAIDETLVAYAPPEVVEPQELPPPPEETMDAEPEDLEEAPPALSLEQLDIALNPGTGGSLVGDFAMPTIRASQKELGTEEFVDFSDLDRIPRPIGVTGFDFPRHLLRKKVHGKIVLLIKLSESGEVLDIEVGSSDLPEFTSFVLDEVRRWRFTAPTQGGTPVRARARLPIPINIS